jgi:cell division protein FtsB
MVPFIMTDPVSPRAGASTAARPRRRMIAAHEVREKRRRLVTWGLFGISSVLMVNALVGETGYLANLRADREYTEVQDALARTRLENQQLQDQIRRMQDDPAALEEVARREHGMLSPGETLVIVKDPPVR